MPSIHRGVSVLFEEVNGTEKPELEWGSLPEPIPDWDAARLTWKWGWQLHTYGFGAGFFLLALYAIVAIFEFRKRLKVQQYLLGINGILLLMGLSRATYLFVDPYHSTLNLPSSVSQVLYGITFPCLTSSFSLIQMVFMRITKVRMGPNKFQNYRVLAAIITSHFTIVIVIDVTVAYKNNFKLLLLLCQSIFITWGLVLCFGFVYGGFKMTQFTNETQRVLKQLVAYNRVKQETLKNGNHRELALHRISKPKIRITDEENKTQSYGSDTSALDSSETMSFYNEAHLEFDEETIAKAYTIGNFDRGYKSKLNKRGDPDNNREVNSHLNKSDSQADGSSESDYVTDTPSTPGPLNDDLSSSRQNREDDPNLFQEVDIMSQSVCSSTAPMLTEGSESPPTFTNLALDVTMPRHKNKDVITNGYVANVNVRALNEAEQVTSQNGNEAISMEEIPQESGYMADTELSSPKRRKKKSRGKHREVVEEEPEENEPDSNSPVHQPYPLKMADGTVSLYRIRQGRVLQKTLRITYLTTLFGFICAILHLYAMFGVYGVLSTDHEAESWPWFVFHTFCRLAELSMAVSMATTTFYFAKQRHRAAVRRKHRHLQNQTKC